MNPGSRRRKSLLLALFALAASLTIFFLGGFGASPDDLVVYCAHDSLYSEGLLRRFENETGIKVAMRFDTEATKALGLVNMIIREKDNPRCDVFWNNQVQGTLDLQDHGLLVPYQGPGFQRIPDKFKDPQGRWAGFAARLRVYIVNTNRMSSDVETIERLQSGDLSRMAVAKPLYGTTRSHYTVLWYHWGRDRLVSWHHDTRRRNVREVDGNATVKNLVAEGKCDFGWTDTDDFFVASDEGFAVKMQPIRVDGQHTICIPNTVAIIQGTKKPEQARVLVDFLLSEETEIALAESKSRQIPLGTVDAGRLPDKVKQLQAWARDGFDLTTLGDARKQCLDWLRAEYLQ